MAAGILSYSRDSGREEGQIESLETGIQSVLRYSLSLQIYFVFHEVASDTPRLSIIVVTVVYTKTQTRRRRLG